MSASQTAKLELPFIMPSQAQKHIPHNEALQILDALYGLSVVTDSLDAPPANPDENARYLIAASAIGDWAGQDQNIAMWRDMAWHIYVPQTGWRCFIEDIGRVKIWSGDSWGFQQDLDVSQGLTVPKLGLNATADDTNRFTLSSSNALFNHAGAGHRLSLNKQSVSDSAAVVFQTNFSSRVEMGISEDDNFRLKVSPDGMSFHNAFQINSQNGQVSFPNEVVHSLSQKPILSFLPSAPKSLWKVNASREATPRSYEIATVSGGTINLTTSNVETIYSDAMRNVAMVRLWNMSKSPPEPCWVNYNNSSVQINVADPSTIVTWGTGDIVQLGDPVGEPGSGANSGQMVAVDISNYLFNEYGTVFKPKAISLYMTSEAVSGAARLRSSETGIEEFQVTSLSDGTQNSVALTLPCSIASPISNSHLVYFDEALLSGGVDFSTLEARILGVWV